MKKNPSKKLKLAKETLHGLEKLVRGGTIQWSDPIVCGGGGGDTSAGFYDNPESCGTK
ncbi:MAG TPA: hypothetical protein VF789_05145 [Thermoanaerobaculia bacterium]